MAETKHRGKTRHDGTPITLDWMWSVSIPEPNSGCWIWDLFVSKDGYAKVHIKRGEPSCAHRKSYELAKGPIPPTYEVDHLCRVTCCINPDHLEAVTPEENGRRKMAAYRPPAHCKKGHAFGPDNIPIIKPPSKSHNCRICRAAIVKKWNDITNGKNLRPITEEQRLANLTRARKTRWDNERARRPNVSGGASVA